MRVLLDECIEQMGWTTIKNGELLALASRAFDVFVTVDRNLSLQQNIGGLPIAVIILAARTNRLADLIPRVPELLSTIASARHGTTTVVAGS